MIYPSPQRIQRQSSHQRKTTQRVFFKRTSIYSLLFLCVLCGTGQTACGRKGPPLPPFVYLPAPVGEFTARRVGGDIVLNFKIPTTNTNNIGPADLERVEIYAHTGPLPAPADYLKHATLIGTIPIKPPPDPDAPGATGASGASGASGSSAVAPQGAKAGATGASGATGATSTAGATAAPMIEQGWATSVREMLTPALLEPGALPYVKQVPTTPALPDVVETPGTVNLPPPVMRYYVVMGISRKNKKGAFAGPLGVPISSELPPSPESPEVKYSQDALSLTWTPAAGGSSRFNVYEVEESGSSAVAPQGAKADASDLPAATPQGAKAGVAQVLPANAAVLLVPAFTDKVVFGTRKCYAVRSVTTVGAVVIESEPTPPVCVTPTDTFPPAAPKQLASVSDEKGVNLIWEANTEPDLAGYIVLRGEGSGETMTPLTPEAIHETSYRDSMVQPGHSYVYAVVAVDNATPPNRSEESNRQTEVMR